MEGMVHSIETFGTLDGPGLRFVLFLKGCPLRCLYCHNPDTWTQDGAKTCSSAEIFKEFLKYKNYYAKGGITIAGGEPLMQIDFITEIYKSCHEAGFNTACDTSGIIFNPDDKELMAKFDELVKYCDLFILDLKELDEKKHIALTGKSNK